MSSRAIKDARRESYTERLQRALNRPVNEAIKLPEPKAPPSSTQTLTSHALGTGAAAKAARAMKRGTGVE